MRNREFQAREKKVQKMTRDGLTEKNLAQGTVKNISSRTADLSFAREREEEPAGRVQSRTQKKKRRQKMRAQAYLQGTEGVSLGLEPDKHFSDRHASEVQETESPLVPVEHTEDGHAASESEAEWEGAHKKKEIPVRRRKRYAFVEENRHLRRDGRRRMRFSRDREEDQERPEGQEENNPPDGEQKEEPSRRTKKQGFSGDAGVTSDTKKRLHFEEEKQPDAGGKLPGQQPSGQTAGQFRQKQSCEKAARRVRDAQEKLERAEAKIPAKRRARLRRQYDSQFGKVKHRLRFEIETIPEDETRLSRARAGQAVRTAAALKLDQKLREAGRDNVGVEAAHKTGLAAGRAGGRLYRSRRRWLQEKPYREVRAAKRRLTKAGADLAYQEFLEGNPELRKKVFAKWLQKQKIKRKYAAAAREAQKDAQHAAHALVTTGQAARALAQQVTAKKTVLGIVGIALLLAAVFGSLASSSAAMLSGIQSAVVATCYVADDRDINESELKYTELETDLQIDINHTKENHPGYDEYRYSIGEIGHNPYELMGYLSAAFDDFTYAQVEPELYRLFGLQYRLTRDEIVETRTATDAEGNVYSYEWHVLQTTLAVQSLSAVISGSLAPGDQTDRYGVYMQTCGNRQCYGNPFDFPWLPYVTSPYGYRVHPATGEKELHRGVDIGVAGGTPVKAIQDGRVLLAGNAGGYGLCVVVEGTDGYRSRYAHCSSLRVSVGQEVARGDVIAAVGNTGSSTGPHLHLEVTHNGEDLNPYYFVEGGGTAESPAIPEDPGEAMGDGSFAAMLAEAEKYLGFPYVWGGSSPSTSFDCSGFVSWVINHSGVGNVGRQTAQGLYNLCTPVAKADLQPGDLVFFTGTYSTANPVTHVGIYVGGGKMIHCGNPISYASINTNYWTVHYYSGGRLP